MKDIGNKNRVIRFTCTNHCDGGFNVDPFICVNARMHKYQAIKMGLLHPSQCILNGVIILQTRKTLSLQRSWKCLSAFIEPSSKKKKRNCWSQRSIPTYSLCLCIWLDYYKSVLQNQALHVLLYTVEKEKQKQRLNECFFIFNCIYNFWLVHPRWTVNMRCKCGPFILQKLIKWLN